MRVAFWIGLALLLGVAWYFGNEQDKRENSTKQLAAELQRKKEMWLPSRKPKIKSARVQKLRRSELTAVRDWTLTLDGRATPQFFAGLVANGTPRKFCNTQRRWCTSGAKCNRAQLTLCLHQARWAGRAWWTSRVQGRIRNATVVVARHKWTVEGAKKFLRRHAAVVAALVKAGERTVLFTRVKDLTERKKMWRGVVAKVSR